jgi:DNA-binding Lrp family transcriptional regulator
LGVPDFTAFIGPTSGLIARQALAVPPVVSDIDAGILSVAHVRRSSDVGELAAALGWPISTLARRMRRLVVTGALIEVQPGMYVRPPEIAARGRLYAIETKIEDWTKALRQVRTYRVWADGYVLVMGGLSDRTVDSLLTEVRHDRGGLVVAGKWLARPRLGETAEWRRLQAIERFAAVTESGLQSPAFSGGVES